MNKNTMLIILYFSFLFSLIFIFGYIAFKIQKKNEKKKNKTREYTVKDFLIGKEENLTFTIILSGLIFGIIFGFLDNFFLISGLDIFESILPRNSKLRAGWGNTYSDLVGSILGTFVSYALISYLEIDQNNIPLWTNSVGMIIGCILGMYIPYFFMKNNF
jgi:hypothetical protein